MEKNMAKVKAKAQSDRGLKEKDIRRLTELNLTHPGDMTPEMEKEKEKLNKLLATHGKHK